MAPIEKAEQILNNPPIQAENITSLLAACKRYQSARSDERMARSILANTLTLAKQHGNTYTLEYRLAHYEKCHALLIEETRNLIKEVNYGLQVMFRRFPLGSVVMTTTAANALLDNGRDSRFFISHYRTGDWGEISDADKKANDIATVTGNRIVAAYDLPDGQRIQIITEADRSVTTLLLAGEN